MERQFINTYTKRTYATTALLLSVALYTLLFGIQTTVMRETFIFAPSPVIIISFLLVQFKLMDASICALIILGAMGFRLVPDTEDMWLADKTAVVLTIYCTALLTLIASVMAHHMPHSAARSSKSNILNLMVPFWVLWYISGIVRNNLVDGLLIFVQLLIAINIMMCCIIQMQYRATFIFVTRKWIPNAIFVDALYIASCIVGIYYTLLSIMYWIKFT